MNRPNILIVTTHDSGRFFGCYGVGTVRTPRVDGLAAEGVLLGQFTAVSPICTPSRGAMLTGRYPQRNGLIGLTHHGFQFKAGERHLARMLGEAGYATTLFHFQHVAERHEWVRLGFQEFLLPSRDDEFPNYPDMAIPAGELGAGVAEWLEARGKSADARPFFVQVNFNETHTPFEFGGVKPDGTNGVTVPPWIERDAESEAHFAMLQGSAAAFDTGLGRILDGLVRAGLAEDTIVVYATDHGFEAMRDKWTLYESGVGIACMFRIPGIAGGRRIDTPISNVDFTPTILELAGVPQPDPNGPHALDGTSFAGALRGGEAEPRPVFAIYHNTGCRSVREGDWKLIRNFAAEPYQQEPPVTMGRRKPAAARPPVELYNLADDPNEFRNLSGTEPAIEKHLNALLAGWMHETNDPAWVGG